MNITSKNANKLLKQLNEEHSSLLNIEEQSSTFLAAVGEDVESVRPAYDYEDIQNRLSELEMKIIRLKHAINLFNTSTRIEEFDMNIDELLVYIPQLTARKNKLEKMKNSLSKQRVESYNRSNIIDYRYINYDIDKVKEDYRKTVDELNRAQVALDEANVNLSFDIEL